jgi:ATP-binding cassette subfamily C protein
MARALVLNPRLLLLDEVTSALDPETEREIVSNVAKLRGKYTIVAITHRPAWTEIADRLYQIEEGTARLIKPVIGQPPKPKRRAARKSVRTSAASA